MTYEIERRFIVRLEGTILTAETGRRLEQVYLSTGEPGVRVRRAGEAYTLTVKAGRGLVREEVEAPLPREAGKALLEMGAGRRLDKVRHRLGRWEVDVFEGALTGLILAEVELVSEDEPLPPHPRGVILLREVTDDGRFVNQSLAALDNESAKRLVAEVIAGWADSAARESRPA